MNDHAGSLAKLFDALWESADNPDVVAFLDEHSATSLAEKAEVLAVDQVRRWPLGKGRPVEEYFQEFPDVAANDKLKVQLIVTEFICLKKRGAAVDIGRFVGRFPEVRDALLRRLEENRDSHDNLLDAGGQSQGTTALVTAALAGFGTSEEDPSRIGRFRIERKLDAGGFGKVYLAYDDQLDRRVAIKVPRTDRGLDPEMFISEARSLARLDHPGVVPVYEVGGGEGTGEDCYMVQKYVEGKNLATLVDEEGPLDFPKLVDLIATVAETLQYVHSEKIVHRDIKPANIIIDVSGAAILTDFGVALKAEDFGRPTGVLGTLPYLSPEQARGEGHRVDGRSDIFSLGVVLYELLTGMQPFRGENVPEIISQIKTLEARPPRQIDASIDRELERICLKALAKRVSERYNTALDMAEDLRRSLADNEEDKEQVKNEKQPESVRPKVLRSFDVEDRGFFLELLPGPRDHRGLPDSVGFWKTRIEERDLAKSFRVGLLYGPSGGGKTSFVKAGLLPHLDRSVSSVFVEARPSGTEARLLNLVRNRCGHPGSRLGLTELLIDLRLGGELPAGQKLLIVIDQFEQWLYARNDLWNSELIPALRQCDGHRVQCLITVRADFWMAVTRFFRELEIDLVEGENMGAVAPFDPRHARYVLAAFGHAFRALPAFPDQLTTEQERFLREAVDDLADDGKVIPVHLALFAEMIRSKKWSPATLKEVGGARGVGEKFLEETFCSRAAPPEHLRHEKAARAILKCLLPPPGTDMKGHMRTRDELLKASGYGQAPEEFNRLMEILDGKVKFLTPVDTETVEQPEADVSPPTYQLTHDYLVPSLRNWLTRKQGERYRGRLELRLAERAALWSAKPERKQLPSWWEWLNFRLFLRKSSWQETERQVMKAAARFHLTRGVFVALALLIVGWGIREITAEVQSALLVTRLLEAKTEEVPEIVSEMLVYESRILPRLEKANDTGGADERRLLHLSLALLPFDSDQLAYLINRVWRSSPEELRVIRESLYAHSERFQTTGQIKDQLWKKIGSVARTGQEKLRGLCVLARLDPRDSRWDQVGEEAAGWLLYSENAVLADQWSEMLTAVREFLIPWIENSFLEGENERERSISALVLGRYFSGEWDRLVALLRESDEHQLGILVNAMATDASAAIGELRSQLKEIGSLPEATRDEDAVKQANLVIALILLGDTENIWTHLRRRKDPRLRTALIHRIAPCGVSPDILIQRLEKEKEPSIQRALLLSLGEYAESQLPQSSRDALVSNILEMYTNDPDRGIHSAAEWLLRVWDQDNLLAEIGEKLQDAETVNHQWYVNTEGHTMIVIHGPVHFLMGSPKNEPGRDSMHEQERHDREIDYSFAISTKEVTIEQFARFDSDYKPVLRWNLDPRLPANGLSAHYAMQYCQWLSEQSGIVPDEWCYEKIPGTSGKLRLREDAHSRVGYRLPTEAEWEYTCRGGTETVRYDGGSPRFWNHYAWSHANSGLRTHKVGQLKPNDFGLFDTHGNVAEWCQSPFDWERVDTSQIGTRFKRNVLDDPLHPVRGGYYLQDPKQLRSSGRNPSLGKKSIRTGFRIVRTIGKKTQLRIRR